ncbi:MAG TPA: type II toxin-antitoxin system VapC family toxin [Gaiellaceae bacterium]|nr:type II toxin-antitoxin system VapC family toxin [Gaiellaceae bacterium]
MLVIDASVAVAACYARDGFAEFRGEHLVAPALMWSEARSALHELRRRGEVSTADAEASRARLERCPVEVRRPRALGDQAWRIADDLGWAKTYDAEYVALARLLDCRLVTLDARLRRSTEHLGFVISPLEI